MSLPGPCPDCHLRELFILRSSECEDWTWKRKYHADSETMHLDWSRHHQREALGCALMARRHEERVSFHRQKMVEFMRERRQCELRLASMSEFPWPLGFSDGMSDISREVSDGGSTQVGGPAVESVSDSDVHSF